MSEHRILTEGDIVPQGTVVSIFRTLNGQRMAVIESKEGELMFQGARIKPYATPQL